MNFEQLKKLVDNILENEYAHALNEDLGRMKDFDKYQSIKEAINTLRNSIMKNLSKEQKETLITFEDLLFELSEMENEFYFNNGVRVGLVNLNFLNDINAGLII